VIFQIVVFWVTSAYLYPEYWDSRFLRNVDNHLRYCMVSLSRRTPFKLSLLLRTAVWPIQRLQRGQRNPEMSSSKCVAVSIEYMWNYVATCKTVLPRYKHRRKFFRLFYDTVNNQIM
jgi:hypothetical protein